MPAILKPNRNAMLMQISNTRIRNETNLPTLLPFQSPQEVQTQPAERKEYHNTRPEDPLVLPRPPLDHADRVPGHTERVGDRVQPLLRALEHLALCTQVTQDRLAPRDVLIQRRVGTGKEVLLPQRVVLPRHIIAAHPVPTTRTAPNTRTTTRIPHVSPATITTIRAGRRGARGVGVLGRGGVGPAPQ